MKVFYDNEVDALYLRLGEGKPEGVVEIWDGVNLDVASDGKLIGIEIIEASKKLDIETILSYTLELDKSLLHQEVV